MGLAFTMERGRTNGAFIAEDAEEYALRELRKAGISASGVMIEAFENQTGWLVFCTVDIEKEITCYIRFGSPDDFLDAVSVHGTYETSLKGWHTGNGYTVRVTGNRVGTARYVSRLSEYGVPFDAPAGYALHLDDQTASC
jgi:hypothetical protein